MHVTSSSCRPLCSTTLSAAAVRLEQHLECGRASVPELGPAPAASAKASADEIYSMKCLVLHRAR